MIIISARETAGYISDKEVVGGGCSRPRDDDDDPLEVGDSESRFQLKSKTCVQNTLCFTSIRIYSPV